MGARLLRWSIVAMTLLWFGVVVPFHERGQIKLPGSRAANDRTVASASGLVIAAARHCCPRPAGEAPDSRPSPRDCAICHVAKTIDVPLPPDLTPAELGLLAVLPPERGRPLCDLHTPSAETARAPPTLPA